MSVTDFIMPGVTLLLGGSGWAAIHAFLVRPRVFMDTREQTTAQVFIEKYRAQMERAMASLGVPTASFDVAWWNRGLRRADRIMVEVTCPSPIEAWEITPPAADLAGGWVCTHDPLLNNADHHRLRIEQIHLMPAAVCHLIVGYSPTGGGPPRARAYQDNREITLARTRPGTGLSLLAILIGIILFGLAFRVSNTVTLDSLYSGLPALGRFGLLLGVLAIALAALMGPMFLVSSLASGGLPPWAPQSRRPTRLD